MVEVSDELRARATQLAEQFKPNPLHDEVAITAPGEGVGFWNGAASAVEHDGVMYLAYRTRQPIELGRGQGVVIAKSSDGVHFETIQTVSKESMNAESLERPTLIRLENGRWRLYLSCATTSTKHWRVELLEAAAPDQFDPFTSEVVMPGDSNWAVKDTVISLQDNTWHCWATFHPLDEADHEDRMWSKHATSQNGIDWTWDEQFALSPRAGTWDSRGARLTAVVHLNDLWLGFYDGRASAAENYEERTGLAASTDGISFTSLSDRPFAESVAERGLRYLDIVPLTDCNYRLYYEVATPDDSHELRTRLVRL